MEDLIVEPDLVIIKNEKGHVTLSIGLDYVKKFNELKYLSGIPKTELVRRMIDEKVEYWRRVHEQ